MRIAAVWATALMLVALAGCSGPVKAVAFSDGFEGGLGPWQKGAEVPLDPNRPGSKVNWSIEPSGERFRSGDRSARFHLDGSQDDGTIWIVHRLDVTPGSRYAGSVKGWYWSASESFNTIAYAVAYLGAEAPAAEADFPEPGQTVESGHRMGLRLTLNQAEGWFEYGFDADFVAPQTGSVFVALGISAVWETEMTYFLDDVSVALEPEA